MSLSEEILLFKFDSDRPTRMQAWIDAAKELEAKAANWDLLEKLPPGFNLYRYSSLSKWHIDNGVNDFGIADTPAEALQNYFKEKGDQ